MQMHRLILSFCIIGLITGLLAGCSPASGPLKTSLSLGIGQADAYYISPALEATAAQFFGPSTGNGGLVDIDKDTLSSSSSTPYRKTHTYQLRLTGQAELPLGTYLSLTGGLTLAKGRSRYLLPKGAGVLSDPITIRFDTTTAEVETGLAWQFNKIGRLATKLELGGGASFGRTRTAINSALLNVHNTSSSRAGFIYTGIGLRLGKLRAKHPSLNLNTRVKYYPSLGVSMQTGLSLKY